MTVHEIGNCTILQGGNLELLRLLPDNSVHTCVTDPPYGIGFMGKKWDTFNASAAEKRAVVSQVQESDNPNLRGRARSPAASPSAIDYDRSIQGQRGFQSWTEQWAREVFRVLRPGAHMLVCGAPRSYHRMASGVEDAGFETRDCIMWVFGQGFPKSHNLHGDWEGWGTAFKPAWEPILVARKPLEGTVAQNAAKWGCGALNIDASRIGAGGQVQWSEHRGGLFVHPDPGVGVQQPNQKGRWPANLIHDGSDEVLECFPELGKSAGGRIGNAGGGNVQNVPTGTFEKGDPGYGDTGSAARFFYCAKTSRKDRNEGCEALPLREGGMRSETSGQHLTRRDGGDPVPVNNNHPTVKPTALMRYLIKLVTPPGGVVLDPFFGSGSTGKACILEGLGCIGMEREADYVAIAKARCEHAQIAANRLAGVK